MARQAEVDDLQLRPTLGVGADDQIVGADVPVHHPRRVERLETAQRLDRQLGVLAQEPAYRQAVGALRCFRGIDTRTALGLVTELHGIERFRNPRGLMAFVGLVPSEASSGEKQRRGAITKANGAAGADFIKTSTGKINPAATMEVTLVMLHAIRDHYLKTGQMIAMKPVGGIRKSKEALHYLMMVKEELGEEWLSNHWFRFGASSLANDILMQLAKESDGHYQSADYFSND